MELCGGVELELIEVDAVGIAVGLDASDCVEIVKRGTVGGDSVVLLQPACDDLTTRHVAEVTDIVVCHGIACGVIFGDVLQLFYIGCCFR